MPKSPERLNIPRKPDSDSRKNDNFLLPKKSRPISVVSNQARLASFCKVGFQAFKSSNLLRLPANQQLGAAR